MNLGDPTGVIAFALIIIFVFQFFAYFIPTSKFWKYCDYLWLLMLLIGVFAATSEINRKYIGNIKYDYYEAIRAVNRIKHEIEHQRVLIKNTRNKQYYPEYRIEPQNFEKYDRWVEKSIEEISQMMDTFKLNNYYSEDRLRQFKRNINSKFSENEFKTERLTSRLEQINIVTNDAIKEFEEYEEWRKKQERKPIEDIAYFFGPFFLIISIGIRLGKTTANLKANKTQNNVSPKT